MSGAHLSPGDVLSERYKLGGHLGTGGTASVYEANDSLLGVRRAVKVIDRTGPHMREQLRKRLKSEARAMAQLAHPNILTIHDIGLDGEVDYVIMDLAEGGSLAEWLQSQGPLAPTDSLRYMIQVLSALAAAHAAGIVHRDVKPQNILLDRHGVALLADFGIAMLTNEEAWRSTRTGVAMGSLSFMAPEQRLDARSVGVAADVYAAGASLYNLLTNANPVDLFTADESSSRFEGMPVELRRIIVKATRYEPEERYPDARSMAAEMVNALVVAGNEPLRPSGSSDPSLFPAPAPSLATGGGTLSGRTPTALPPASREATNAAITFLGDDFEEFAKQINETLLPLDTAMPVEAPMPIPVGLPGDRWPAPAPAIAGRAVDESPSGLTVLPSDQEERSPMVYALVALGLLALVGIGWWMTRPDPVVDEPVAVAPIPPPEDAVVEAVEPVGEPAPEDGPEGTPTEGSSAGKSVTTSGAASAGAVSNDTVVRVGKGKASATTTPTESPSTGLAAPLGGWSFKHNGVAGRFMLKGSPSKITGTVKVGGFNTGVRGSYNPSSRKLSLTEEPTHDAAMTWSLTLKDDLSTASGQVTVEPPNERIIQVHAKHD